MNESVASRQIDEVFLVFCRKQAVSTLFYQIHTDNIWYQQSKGFYGHLTLSLGWIFQKSGKLWKDFTEKLRRLDIHVAHIIVGVKRVNEWNLSSQPRGLVNGVMQEGAWLPDFCTREELFLGCPQSTRQKQNEIKPVFSHYCGRNTETGHREKEQSGRVTQKEIVA